MPRIFSRGELKRALLAVVDALDEAHGYAIMRELQRRVGGGWRPSPGAIYPALVALEDEGLLEGAESGGLRMYRVTAAGAAALEVQSSLVAWGALEERSQSAKPRLTLGGVLDRFAGDAAQRKRELTDAQAQAISTVLVDAATKIIGVLEQGDDHG